MIRSIIRVVLGGFIAFLSAAAGSAIPGELYRVDTRIAGRCFQVALPRWAIDEQIAKQSTVVPAWGFSEAAAIAKAAAQTSPYGSWIVRLHSVEFDRWPLLPTPICVVRFSCQLNGAEGLLALIVLPDGRVLLPEPCSS